MQFKSLNLFTHNLQAQKEFYVSILGAKLISETSENFTLEIGWSKLTFVQSTKEHFYHYCFLLPENQLTEALNWFEKRIPIVETEEGKIVHFESWNARSFYFYDGSGNIAECIVRHDLNNQSDKVFDFNSLQGVNEMGLPTPSIPETLAQFNAHFHLEIWRGDTDRFAGCGDLEGLFLLPNHTIKKIWFPSEIEITPTDFSCVVVVNDQLFDVRYKDSDIQIQKKEAEKLQPL